MKSPFGGIALLIGMQVVLAYGKNLDECKNLNETIAVAKLIADFMPWRKLTGVVIYNVQYGDEACPESQFVQNQLLKYLNEISISTAYANITKENLALSAHNIAIVVVITDITTISSTLNAISQTGLFQEEYIWLIVFDNALTNTVLDKLCQLDFGIDADITIARYFSGNINRNSQSLQTLFSSNKKVFFNIKEFEGTFRIVFKLLLNNEGEPMAIRKMVFLPRLHPQPLYILEQIYKIRREMPSSCIVSSRGVSYWNGIWYALQNEIVERRSNFYGFPLKMATLDYSVYDSIVENMTDEKHALDLYTSYFLDLFNASSSLFEYDEIGEKDEKSQLYNGILGAVVSNTVDIGIGTVVETYERAADMFFTTPVLITFRSIYLVQPESSSIHDIYMSPFSPLLLGMVLCMCVFIVLLLKMMYILTEEDDLSPSDCAMWCAGILFMQGSYCTPKSLPSLGIVIVGLLFGLIVFNAYSASITSTLSIQFKEINTISDFLATDFSAGLIQGSTSDEFLNETNNKVLKDLKKRTLRNSKNFVKTNREGLDKALKSRHAHFGAQTEIRRTIYTLQKYQRCEISEVMFTGVNEKISFPISLGSPYRKIFMISILKMVERGDVDKIKKYLLPVMPHCEESSQFSSAKISDVFTAFTLLLVIMGVSFCMMIIEVIYRKCKTTKTET